MSGLNNFLMREVEMPLIPVLADLEETGYLINPEPFRVLEARLKEEREKVAADIKQVAGTPDFNPASIAQLKALLFGTLNLPVVKKTASGEPSTDEEVLRVLQDKHQVIANIMRHRELTKLIGTYCCIPANADQDGRLRFEFRQIGAETGRITSRSVIQTLPKDDQLGIRRGFVAPQGYQIVAADYVQQELFMLAGVCKDTNLLEAITQGIDLHGLAAVKVFNLDCQPNEVKKFHKERRDQVKAIQFGLIYGRGAKSLASELNISQDDAEKLLKDYFEQFPSVSNFIDQVHSHVRRDGYIDDLFGRRRYLPDAQLQRPRKKYKYMTKEEQQLVSRFNGALREAQNFVIQGASATVTKLAMIRCHSHIKAEHPRIHMLVTVHDELQFEVPEEEVAHFAAELPGLMCDLGLERFDFPVKMAVEIKVGPTWGDLEKHEPTQEGDVNETTAPTSEG